MKDQVVPDTINGLQQFLVFRLHAREYAFPIDQAIEVLRMVALTPLPEAPNWLPGVINLRGKIIPVIDLRTRLGLPHQTPDLRTAIIVAQADRSVVGLLVDSVVEVLTFPSEAIVSPDIVASSASTAVRIAHVGERLIAILDLHTLCCGAEHMLRSV